MGLKAEIRVLQKRMTEMETQMARSPIETDRETGSEVSSFPVFNTLNEYEDVENHPKKVIISYILSSVFYSSSRGEYFFSFTVSMDG